MTLTQKTLAQTGLADINKRVVVIDGGNSFVGRIEEIHLYTNAYKDYEPYVNMKVRSEGLTKAFLELRNLPLEFVIQIEDDGEAD